MPRRTVDDALADGQRARSRAGSAHRDPVGTGDVRRGERVDWGWQPEPGRERHVDIDDRVVTVARTDPDGNSTPDGHDDAATRTDLDGNGDPDGHDDAVTRTDLDGNGDPDDPDDAITGTDPDIHPDADGHVATVTRTDLNGNGDPDGHDDAVTRTDLNGNGDPDGHDDTVTRTDPDIHSDADGHTDPWIDSAVTISIADPDSQPHPPANVVAERHIESNLLAIADAGSHRNGLADRGAAPGTTTDLDPDTDCQPHPVAQSAVDTDRRAARYSDADR